MSHPALPFALACAGTYEPGVQAQWQDKTRLVHVFLSLIDGIHTIAFEGTSDWQEWVFSDFMAGQIVLPGYVEFGAVHVGFMRDVLSVADGISEYLATLDWPDYDVAGHSKGAGEALLFHAVMKKRGHAPRQTWAFEPARVGGLLLKDYLKGEPIGWTRTHNGNGNDIVTDVPFGPTWWHQEAMTLLGVPDNYDLATKHRIPAVVEALSAL